MDNHRPSVLIIDDEDGVAAAITARLSSLEYQCLTASSGLQGLAVFDREPIDLVITDLHMSLGDGLITAQKLRDKSDVPIIIITGFLDGYRPALQGIENIIVIEKPFDGALLASIVESSLLNSAQNLPSAA